MDEKTPDFKKILGILVEHDVEFVVIGGIGAVLQGAPIATFDWDIVHSRSEKNVHRLQEALRQLDASYRPGADHQLRPNLSHLS